MSIDLIIQSNTKFALHQWLTARGLGQNIQDIDPESPTFGDYEYTHSVGTFLYWNHPSGVVTKSIDTTDPENPVATQFSGFYALLKFQSEIPADLRSWVETSTATSVLDNVSGVGGEGITILNPEDLRAQVVAGGAPLWDGLMGVGNEWSDPALWAFQNVMERDVRTFDGVEYRSKVDFNVHSPSVYPQGWELVDAPTGVQAWAQPTGSHDAYATGDRVTHPNAQDNDTVWLFESAIDANTTEPGTDGTFHRYWTPIEVAQ